MKISTQRGQNAIGTKILCYEDNGILEKCIATTRMNISTAFLGTQWAQCTQSAPRKAVDLDHFSLLTLD